MREKTEKYILEQIESDNKEKITFTKITKTNLKLLDIKSNIDKDNLKNTLSRQNSENFEKSNFSNKNKISKTRVHKRATLQFDESKISEKINPKKSLKKIERYTITPKNKNEDRPKSGRRFFSVINKKRNSIKKRQGRRHETERDQTFYNQIIRKRTMRKRRTSTVAEKPDKEQKNYKMDYIRLISKNIEENQQNLNNPEEYFQGFFKDIISKNKQSSNKPEGRIRKKSTLGY